MLNITLLATQVNQICSLMMMFFPLIVVLRDRRLLLLKGRQTGARTIFNCFKMPTISQFPDEYITNAHEKRDKEKKKKKMRPQIFGTT